MNQIQFGQYRSYDDLYLVLSSKEIGSPEVKEYKVEIEGGDGVLDYTEYFGGVNYGNLELKFEFSTIVQPFLNYYSQVKDLLHGKKMKITLDEDDDFYYLGRISVSSFTNEKNIGTISITCDCEPWKYKQQKTVVTKSITNSSTIVLSNMRKKVVPEITTNTTMSFAFGSSTVTHTAGTFMIPSLELSQGNNTITVTGTGTVKFEYQEGGM